VGDSTKMSYIGIFTIILVQLHENLEILFITSCIASGIFSIDISIVFHVKCGVTKLDIFHSNIQHLSVFQKKEWVDKGVRYMQP
jgi:hypothetical protein